MRGATYINSGGHSERLKPFFCALQKLLQLDVFPAITDFLHASRLNIQLESDYPMIRLEAVYADYATTEGTRCYSPAGCNYVDRCAVKTITCQQPSRIRDSARF